MNAAWYSVVGLLGLAWVMTFAGRALDVGGRQADLEWGLDTFALLLALAAGTAASATWIGQSAIPSVAGLSPWVGLALGIVALVVAVRGILAALPSRVSSLSSSTAMLVGAFLLPMLVVYVPHGQAGDLAHHAITSISGWAHAHTAGWFHR